MTEDLYNLQIKMSIKVFKSINNSAMLTLQRISCCGGEILPSVCHFWTGHTGQQQDCGESAGSCA